MLYTAIIGFEHFFVRCRCWWIIYLHRRGAFGVARFDNLGDARAFTLWNELQKRFRAFLFMYNSIVLNAILEPDGFQEVLICDID